jgi:hypothetical protein
MMDLFADDPADLRRRPLAFAPGPARTLDGLRSRHVWQLRQERERGCDELVLIPQE